MPTSIPHRAAAERLGGVSRKQIMLICVAAAIAVVLAVIALAVA